MRPGILTLFLMWVYDRIYDFYYKHWGYKRWTFGQKWNAMIERENLIILLRKMGFQYEDEC